MSHAVVAGNGESRKHIDLLKFNAVLIGCNAIHRDIKVDHLVCCDRRMVEEAVNNPNIGNTQIYVREDWFKYYRKIQKNKNIHLVPPLPYHGEIKQDQPEHWGSGGYAVLLAAHLGFENITLVGFDLYSKDHRVNNVYKGTTNYSAPDKQSVDYTYWIYQISKIMFYYPQCHFTVMHEPDWEIPAMWTQKNVSFKNIEQPDVELINNSLYN